MNPRHIFWPSALALVPVTPAWAQDDFQQWLTLSARIDPSETLALQNEAVARFSDGDGGLYEIENATMLGLKLSKTVALWAGYVHNPQYDAGSFTIMERRAREQITFDNFASLGAAQVSARLRVEQRWRDGVSGTAWRARPYVKLGVPLGGETAPVFNLTAEPFINLDTTGFQTAEGLERLRSAASLTIPVGKVLRVEAGYLNQHRFVRNGPDTDDHAITVALGFSF